MHPKQSLDSLVRLTSEARVTDIDRDAEPGAQDTQGRLSFVCVRFDFLHGKREILKKRAFPLKGCSQHIQMQAQQGKLACCIVCGLCVWHGQRLASPQSVCRHV